MKFREVPDRIENKHQLVTLWTLHDGNYVRKHTHFRKVRDIDKVLIRIQLCFVTNCIIIINLCESVEYHLKN